MNRALLLGTSVLALAAIGCGGSEGEDTDDNKSYFVDGYQEVTAPSPATKETVCNYSMSMANGGTQGVDYLQILPALTWTGVAPGGTTADATVGTPQFFDCDGSREIHGILIDTSQYG